MLPNMTGLYIYAEKQAQSKNKKPSRLGYLFRFNIDFTEA